MNNLKIEIPENISRDMYLDLLKRHDELKLAFKDSEEQVQEQLGMIKRLNAHVEELVSQLNEVKHEDEVVITTKHKIKSIDLYFEGGCR